MRKLHTQSLLAVSLSLLIAACSGGVTPTTPNDITVGQTEFVTETANGSDGRGQEDDLSAPPNGAPVPTSAPENASDSGNGAPSGREGQVEEADIYRIDNNNLYYLNTYKGFVIYDFNDPKAPRKISSLPVYGYPVEMFVEGTTLYALLRDVLYLNNKNGTIEFETNHVSQLVTIDVSDLQNPRILSRTDINGQLREGVSRKIDNSIYVVSFINYWSSWYYQPTDPDVREQAWVYSFDISNASNPTLVEQLKIFEFKEENNNGTPPSGGVVSSRDFRGISISATSNALMVAENWTTYGDGTVTSSTSRCRNYNYDEFSRISIVDISDTSGDIRVHSKFESEGHISDQFKMTYQFDEQTNRGYFYGIFGRRTWGGTNNCEWTSQTINTIESWDVSNGDSPTKVDTLQFGKPDESVVGSAFDLSRNMAYAITARQIDPLYAIDISDPADLRIRDFIDGLSGDISLFRLIGGGQFLLAIGRDTSDTCTGFDTAQQRWQSNVAVSIVDVQNPDAIRLVQRKCIDVDARWVSSEINWNLDQAHKLIGTHSDGTTNILTVPVSYYAQNSDSPWGRYQTAVGMMTWDLSAYDPQKNEREQTVLQNFGTVLHPNGTVRRSIIFNHEASTRQRMMLNLSDTHLSLTNIQNLSAPQLESTVELAPFVKGLFSIGDYVIEHVTASAWDYQGGSELRVKRGGGDIDDKPIVSSTQLTDVREVIKVGTNLVLLKDSQTATVTRTGYNIQAIVYDYRDPSNPVETGRIDLPIDYYPYYSYYCGHFGGYWFDDSDWAITADSLVFKHDDYNYQPNTGRSTVDQSIVILDLSDSQNPTLETIDLPTTDANRARTTLFAGSEEGNAFYVESTEYLPSETRDGTNFGRYKNYIQRWERVDGSWSSQARVNVPGRLVDVWTSAEQRYYLTQDYQYTRVDRAEYIYWEARTRISYLKQIPQGAELLGKYQSENTNINALIREGDRLYATDSSGYYYYYRTYQDEQDRPVPDKLLIFSLANDKLELGFTGSFGLYGAQLMGVYQNKAFIKLGGDGVVTLDVSNIASPVGTSFLRTLGWVRSIDFVGDDAYLASGYYGIYNISLNNQ